jgi:uncharacterized alpha-E superfamily protein
MLSRVADSIYWMSRYVERAENVARFVNVNLLLSLDSPRASGAQWEPLVIITGDRAPFEARFEEPSRRNVLFFLTFDNENPNSIRSCIHLARENARSVREVISIEMWESINKTYHLINDAARVAGMPADLQGFYRRVIGESHLFRGVTDATMSHGQAWSFARLGRLLERADKTSRILDVKYFILLPEPSSVGTPFDSIQWVALLRSASALQMYRQKHRRIDPGRVAEYLILDRDFPRSLHYCVVKAEETLHAITQAPRMTYGNPAEQKLGRLRADLDYAHIDEIISHGLHEYLDTFQTKLNAVGDAIFETFFAVKPIAGAVSSESRSSSHDVLSGHSSE